MAPWLKSLWLQSTPSSWEWSPKQVKRIRKIGINPWMNCLQMKTGKWLRKKLALWIEWVLGMLLSTNMTWMSLTGLPDACPWKPTLPEIKASRCHCCLLSYYSGEYEKVHVEMPLGLSSTVQMEILRFFVSRKLFMACIKVLLSSVNISLRNFVTMASFKLLLTPVTLLVKWSMLSITLIISSSGQEMNKILIIWLSGYMLKELI